MRVKQWHRALGLGLALFWLVQAASGAAIELVWWLDSVSYHDVEAPPRPQVLAHGLETLRAEGASVGSVWSAGTVASQAKFFYSDRQGQYRVRRIDSAGKTLYDVRTDSRLTHEGFMQTISELHKTLLLGPNGQWLVAASGVFLVLSLVLGVQLALRGRVRLRQVLFWKPASSPTVRRFQTHRMLGGWVVIPALALALTGALLAWTEGLQSVRTAPAEAASSVAAEADSPAASDSSQAEVAGPEETGPARAIELALAALPGSRLSALILPDATRNWYEVLVRAPGETQRFWGTTRIHVAALGGKVERMPDDALPALQRFSEWLYPYHTGLFGGLWMRGTALLVGLVLLVTAVYGLLLWNARRARPRARAS